MKSVLDSLQILAVQIFVQAARDGGCDTQCGISKSTEEMLWCLTRLERKKSSPAPAGKGEARSQINVLWPRGTCGTAEDVNGAQIVGAIILDLESLSKFDSRRFKAGVFKNRRPLLTCLLNDFGDGKRLFAVCKS